MLLLLLFLAHYSYGQRHDVWVRYYDSTAERSGYKDLDGTIKIPVIFGGFTRADSFYHIMAVQETADNSYNQYYLLKDGRKVGRDSVFVFDFTFDCESEGKILFKDYHLDRVGFLNEEGHVIIPALYNYASPFRNGMALAYRNGKKECWEPESDTLHCEHWSWVGGETVLINEQNQILADSLHIDLSNVNWYSKRVNDPAVDTSTCLTIKGRNNTLYSFVDYRKEFSKWFYHDFLTSLENKNGVRQHIFTEVTYWSTDSGWISRDRDQFLKAFPSTLTKERFRGNKLKEISIGSDDLNELIFEKELYKRYYTACGEHNGSLFPMFRVYVTYYKKRGKPLPADIAEEASDFTKAYDIDYQEHFEFLRTEEGYKLLSVSLNR